MFDLHDLFLFLPKRLKVSNGLTQDNKTITCARVDDGFLFGGLSTDYTCEADPTTTAPPTTRPTTAATTTTAGTTAEPTKPPAANPPYVPSEHSTFTNDLFLSITIPAMAGA